MKLKNNNLLDYRCILSEKGISRTQFRTDLVNFFYSSNKSLSVEEILIHFDNSINKVTVYRSLVSFENKGLIHKVPDTNNLMRYSLCRENECNSRSHNHNHGHFICYSCNETFCLEGVKSPEIIEIKGFYVKELKLTAEGYCQQCYKN
jgi:Fur family ferric uptake transcriptional regulator